ncbi:nitroreductase family protein [Comamonas sp. JNW]|uniref:nitroreductase family protein n=1 Tax=Comamonas sp. JNW TaxID=2170731 RepID=UPI000DE6F4EC|nr:nitroreductase family protein [Comamonas sp. JNW]PWB16878.1 nitroreductase [Comamonas sp. JNW]
MTTRQSTHAIHPQFLDRFSPRAFSGKALTHRDIETIVEGARWAPSASNKQPWHFAYSINGDANWQAFSTIPNEFNRRWCLNAGALLVVLSNKDESPAPSFDTGCAWGYLALQAHAMGLATHAMGGIERDAARAVLKLGDNWQVECLVAIGERGDKSSLPADLAERETPSPRKALSEILTAGPLA